VADPPNIGHDAPRAATWPRSEEDTLRYTIISQLPATDLQRTRRWYRDMLVSPDGEKTAWFKDSEGNILALGSTP
jgi:hypothetical protein